MDFTIKVYESLLKTLKQNEYFFQTFQEFVKYPERKAIVLRHDVDLLPSNSLKFAKIQSDADVSGTYYFRAVVESWDKRIIKEIDSLGHEIGYHYETMDTANGDVDKAWDQFRYHLDELRELVNVKTICMHGSPRSKFVNKDIWEKYDYRSVGIVGEPYFDINFDDVFYLTDTGRRWDGWKFSVRDKLPQQMKWNKEGLSFHSTSQIIEAIKDDKLPNQIMMTFHPQRWHNKPLPWVKELIWQNTKNIAKYFLIKLRK